MIQIAYTNSPIGLLRLTATPTHLLRIEFVEAINPPPEEPTENPIIQTALTQLSEYFKGERQTFSVPFQLQGTPFQQRVWQGLLTIPYGQTLSYGELAQRIGAPRAYRAVGNANRLNPIPIIVPCHRVIQANGQLGGYASGVHIKQFLLTLEQQFRTPELP